MKITKETIKERLRSMMKEDSEYQVFFRKALEKAGKSIPSMSDEEKKAFFNKIDATWDGKGEKNEGNAFGAAVVAAKKAGEDEFEVGGKTFKVESVNEEVYTQKIKFAMQNSTSSFKNLGNDFKKAGLKYNFSTTPFPHYIVEPGGNKKVAIVSNKNQYDLKGSGIQYSTYIATIKESVNESHFKVGDNVECIKSGMSGKIIGLDKAHGGEDEPYYRVETEDGKVVKYAPNAIKLRESEVNEAGPGLWANIRAKQARGEAPARKGSKAYKSAVKAGNKINNEESVNEAKAGEFEMGDFVHFKSANKTGMVKKISGDKVTITTLKGEFTGNIQDIKVLYQDDVNTSVNEGVSPTDMAKIKGAVEAASSFMNVGSELKKLGMKYTFATEPLPIYIIQPTPNNKVAIVNKKYATKPDFVVGDIAVGIMEGKLNEGTVTIQTKDGKLHNYPNFKKDDVISFLTKNKMKQVSNKNNLKTNMDFYVVESVNEGKDDFVARYGKSNILLKKGYKHHTADELEALYDKVGKLVKGLNVKDVNVVFESVNEAFKHIIHVDTPTQVVSKPVAAQIMALAKKGIRSNEIGLEMGFTGNAKLAADTFQKVKSRIYFELDKRESVVTEGKKRFKQQDGIGSSKYTISYHDGKKKHKDGSDFFDIQIFKNKPELEAFKKDLVSKGFVSESVNEGKFKKDDLVYNKRTKTIGIVRMGDDKYGEVKTDADGNVNVDELEIFNPFKFKHQTNGKAAPSTEKEVNSRGLFNPFRQKESVNEAKSTKKGNTYYVDSDFVNLSKKGGNLKHLGMGDFAVDVDGGGTISFDRVSEKMPGFSGRTHRVVGNGDDFKKLTKLMGIKSESVNEERNSNLFYVLYQKKDGKFSKPQAAGYTSREDAERFAKSLNNHSTMILDKNDFSGVKGVKVTNESVNEEIAVGKMVKVVDNPYWEASMGKKGPFRRKVKMIDGDNVFFTDGSNSSMKYVKESIESTLIEQLVPVDKKAVDAFFDKKDFTGKNLNSDGKVLKTVGIGSQEMFTHTPRGVKMVGKVTGRYAQSLVQYVMKNHKSDLVEFVNEGRAFINAARKAKLEGKTEFDFNGKKYPVTIK